MTPLATTLLALALAALIGFMVLLRVGRYRPAGTPVDGRTLAGFALGFLGSLLLGAASIADKGLNWFNGTIVAFCLLLAAWAMRWATRSRARDRVEARVDSPTDGDSVQ